MTGLKYLHETEMAIDQRCNNVTIVVVITLVLGVRSQ